MRASTALINPSLFEGWSTTVEEAKSTGTPMILSDLGVHREQAEGMARDGLALSHRDAAAFAKAFVDLIAARAA
jgi:glycosyltransferase involved in cell wall biosynthesis